MAESNYARELAAVADAGRQRTGSGLAGGAQRKWESVLGCLDAEALRHEQSSAELAAQCADPLRHLVAAEYVWCVSCGVGVWAVFCVDLWLLCVVLLLCVVCVCSPNEVSHTAAANAAKEVARCENAVRQMRLRWSK